MRVCIIVGIIFWPILSWGQASEGSVIESARFEQLLHTYQSTDSNQASSSGLEKFIAKVQERKTSFKNDLSFLNYLFYKTHSRFLKQYVEYASFNEVLSTGNYNCLTGTALYALLLDRLGYNFSIIETNYHIFLIVNIGTQRVLFETTDPQHGFISGEYAVNERIDLYKQNFNSRAGNNEKVYYSYRTNLYNTIALEQLTGLLYYNLAVKAYNQQQLVSSIQLLNRAMYYYKSPRIEEFSSIILLTLQESTLKITEEQPYSKQIISLGSQEASGL